MSHFPNVSLVNRVRLSSRCWKHVGVLIVVRYLASVGFCQTQAGGHELPEQAVCPGSLLPSALRWLRLGISLSQSRIVKASASLPQGPRGFAMPAPPITRGGGSAGLPGLLQASPLAAPSAQAPSPSFPSCGSVPPQLSFDCSPPTICGLHVPVLSLSLRLLERPLSFG